MAADQSTTAMGVPQVAEKGSAKSKWVVIMAEKLERKETVTVEELAYSNTFEIAALVAVLERKGLLTKEEIIEEIKRMRQT
jgi:hypothetical protein